LPQTYTQSGVSIAEGDELVQKIKKSVRSTYSRSVLGDIGGFGALYDARFRGYRSPVLVSSVDGVGTKLVVAQMMNRHGTIGQDLVNHCVNDILVCGAKPLFFLDYFATGKLDRKTADKVIGGFIKACKANGCSLIGGETAEMPGFYHANQYDVAGAIVGVVDRKNLIDGRRIRKGDVLVGLRSSGLHTNGYSLARAVLLSRYSIDQFVDELGETVGEALLAVHRSYLRPVSAVLRRFRVHGISHITGGGVVGNTMRVVPKGLGINIDWSAWERPAIFRLIQRLGDVPEQDMRSTFNLGIGLLMVVSRTMADNVVAFLRSMGETALLIGEITAHKHGR
jgi:phosphoribosylformylglycinamidine cyclo-ligase